MSDIVSVSGARVAGIVIALMSTILVTHLLKPRQYAILAYIALLSGLMFTTAASWTSAAVTRYGREELDRQGTMRATSWNRILMTLPVLVVVSLALVVLRQVGALPHALSWTVIGIVLGTGFGSVVSEHVGNLLEAAGRMKLTAVTIPAGALVSIASLGALALLGAAHSATVIATVWMGVAWLVAVAFGKAVWRTGIWPPRVDRQLLRRMAAFSLPLIAFAVSQYVIQAVDIAILGHYRSRTDVGLYAIAYNGYGVLQQVSTTASIVLSPLFVSLRQAGHEHVVARYLQRLVPQALFLVAVCAGLGAPLLQFVVPFIFGHSFSASATPLAILFVSWMLYSLASFVAPILVLHERGRTIGAISALAALVNVSLDLLLVGGFGMGIAGPAIATGVSLGLLAVGYTRVAATCVGLRPPLPILALTPGLAGIGGALALRGLLGASVSILGALVLSVGLVRWGSLISAEDADLLVQLDLPRGAKTLLPRVTAASRE